MVLVLRSCLACTVGMTKRYILWIRFAMTSKERGKEALSLLVLLVLLLFLVLLWLIILDLLLDFVLKWIINPEGSGSPVLVSCQIGSRNELWGTSLSRSHRGTVLIVPWWSHDLRIEPRLVKLLLSRDLCLVSLVDPCLLDRGIAEHCLIAFEWLEALSSL